MPRHSNKKRQCDPNTFYTADGKFVVTLPASAVLRRPEDPTVSIAATSRRLSLCPSFDPAAPKSSCPAQDECPHVHADVSQATTRRKVHVNYAWRSVDEVEYPRFAGTACLAVAPPGSHTIVDHMEACLALTTRALESPKLPLQHCAHYYYSRQCDMGSECMFVHAVFIDPEASDRKLAPAPTDLGRDHGRVAAPLVEIKQTTTPRRTTTDGPDDPHDVLAASRESSCRSPGSFDDVGVASERSSVSSGVVTPRRSSSTGLLERQISTPAAAPPRFRHDPYKPCTMPFVVHSWVSPIRVT